MPGQGFPPSLKYFNFIPHYPIHVRCSTVLRISAPDILDVHPVWKNTMPLGSFIRNRQISFRHVSLKRSVRWVYLTGRLCTPRNFHGKRIYITVLFPPIPFLISIPESGYSKVTLFVIPFVSYLSIQNAYIKSYNSCYLAFSLRSAWYACQGCWPQILWFRHRQRRTYWHPIHRYLVKQQSVRTNHTWKYTKMAIHRTHPKHIQLYQGRCCCWFRREEWSNSEMS